METRFTQDHEVACKALLFWKIGGDFALHLARVRLSRKSESIKWQADDRIEAARYRGRNITGREDAPKVG